MRPWIGVSLYTVDPFVAARYGLSVQSGVLVTEVASGGPAEKAGLAPGDVIVGIDGIDVADVQDFTNVIYGKQIGDEVQIQYWRAGEEDVANAVLEMSPAS